MQCAPSTWITHPEKEHSTAILSFFKCEVTGIWINSFFPHCDHRLPVRRFLRRGPIDSRETVARGVDHQPGSLGGLRVTKLITESSHLIGEHIGETLQEDQGEDVVLELGGVEGTTNLAGRIPQPLFECS